MRNTFSYSKIDCFLSCQEKFRYQYIEKVKVDTPSPIYFAYGNAIHRALEKFSVNHYVLDNLLIEWKLACKGESTAEYTPVFNDNTYSLTKEEKIEFYYRGDAALREYFDKNKKHFSKPTYKVLAVEQKFKVPYKKWYLMGYIDKIESHDSRVYVVDYKTGNWIPTQEEVDKSLQLTIYSYAYRYYEDVPETGLYFHYLKDNTILKTSRQEEDYDILTKILEEIDRVVATNSYTPTEDPNTCSNCVYSSLCPSSQETKLLSLDWSSL